MNRLRLATPEEVEKIKDQSDLDQTCVVFALDTQKGTALGVQRVATEIDPIIVPKEWDNRSRSIFWRDLETAIWAQGAKSVYFNIAVNDVEWIKVMKNYGAEQVSLQPEFRFKKVL